MSIVLKVGNQKFTAAEVIKLLGDYQILPQLCSEIVIDQAIADIESSAEEEQLAYQQFCERHQLTNEAAMDQWCKQQKLQSENVPKLAVRRLKLEKFKKETWAHQIESYFLKRKSQLDRVLYSLIRTQDPGIAQELYFRIQEEESSFADLARKYSQGAESQTGGLIGPTEINTPHPKISQMLAASKSGQIWPPTRVGEWYIIVRLEKYLPAQLDEAMRQKLLNELFKNWLNEQVKNALDSSDEEEE